MKWELFFIVVIVLAIVFIITIATLFYIRHWAARNIYNTLESTTEGVYFKRYIPHVLRSHYDAKNTHFLRQINPHRATWVKFGYGTTISLVLSISILSLINNANILLLPIELTPDEISSLNVMQHSWKRIVDDRLPNIKTVLSTMQERGFIVPDSNTDNGWRLDGVNLRRMSLDHWHTFIKENDFNLEYCQWQNLTACQAAHKDWIILVLPGYWDFEALDTALANGASIILYGPPAQVFREDEDNVLVWHGLTFEQALKRDNNAMILLGDQLLTLGFDAGLIVNASSSFTGYHAMSSSPQALSIGDNLDPGGENETRLYAKIVKQGRLVWMDFAPDPKYQGPSINVQRLNAMLASVFRFLSREPYSAIATWPYGKKFGALIEEDTEDKPENAQRVFTIVKNNSFPISWYILSNEALNNRALIRDLAKVGEIACHGDNHGPFTKSTAQEQTIRIARCQKVLSEITNVKPMAFRPPEEEFNTATINAIANNGMTHYIANNTPDRDVPEIQRSTDSQLTLVSIPRMVNDDYEIWHNRKLNAVDTLSLIDNEIAWVKQIGGLYLFSFHSQYMGKEENVNTIQHMGNTLKQDDTYFATSQDIADWWLFRSKLQDKYQSHDNNLQALFDRFHPVLLTVNEQGDMQTTQVKN